MNNILLLMTNFYDYHKFIIEEMNNDGYDVDWNLDKIVLTPFQTLISKFNKKYISKKFDKYFAELINQRIKKEYSKIIIIFGAVFIREKHINMLRKAFPNTEIVYYAWDSVANFPNIEMLFKKCDLSFTFDNVDAEKYNVKFLPLFYTDNVSKICDIKYDVSTVMTFFVEKYDNLKKIFNIFPNNTKFYLYLKLRNNLYKMKLKFFYNSIYRKIKKNCHINGLGKDDIKNITLQSKAVLDCPLSKQNGLTMRTFETLALNKKLITTNANVKMYDFYTEDNIFVISDNRDDFDHFINSDFNTKYCLDKKYSVKNFVKTLIRGE